MEEQIIGTDPQNGMSALSKIVVEAMIEGKQFDDIADENGLPVIAVVKTWRDYLSNQTRLSRDEQWALHLLRLESFLNKLHTRISASSEWQDYELVLKMLDKLEAMHALNETRKTAADDVLKSLSEQQGQIIAMMLTTFSRGLLEQVQEIVDNGKTLKGIKTKLEEITGEIVDEQIDKALGVLEHAE